MKDNTALNIIATIKTDFPTKFGIPRQSGLIPELKARIVFEPEYRNIDALRGLEGYSHLWIIWKFSEAITEEWSPTVRPPRLGGNKRVGVFATRSPFRPNPIGISCLKLNEIVMENDRVVLKVEGVDMLDGTPVYDVKPYVAFTDSIPNAVGGFSDNVKDYSLIVNYDDSLFNGFSSEFKNEVLKILENDPRPSYHDDPERIYGVNFSGNEIKFKVKDKNLTIISIE